MGRFPGHWQFSLLLAHENQQLTNQQPESAKHSTNQQPASFFHRLWATATVPIP